MSEQSPATKWHTRTETPADVPTVREITLAAFPTAEEAEILDGLRRDPAWIDGLSIVVSDESGRLVGHGVATRGFVDDSPVLGLGPVSVLPQFQNRGAGSAVNRALLEAARQMGEPSADHRHRRLQLDHRRRELRRHRDRRGVCAAHLSHHSPHRRVARNCGSARRIAERRCPSD
ncbi:Predicted acetyltransferase [Mycobacteroides abscessus subsp. abscessus]|nr:Predicted acetyltransferase [Mycobacteroides abscessus subsp. abscessus]